MATPLTCQVNTITARPGDARQVSLPAALQSVRDAYFNLSGVTGLHLAGFDSPWIADFFRTLFPEVKLIDGAAPASGRVLELAKREAATPGGDAADGYRYALDRLLPQYSVGGGTIDLNGL